MKKGFTLTELLITIVVMAVLASIAIPSFAKSAERARANQAIAYLRTIRTAETMFFSKNGTYVTSCADFPACAPCSAPPDTAAEIRCLLGAEVSSADYSFSVAQTATTFVATATRTVGIPATTISLDQNGAWVCTGYTPCPTS